MISGRATLEGTRRFASRASAASGQFREAMGGLSLSSLGLGTYLGEDDAATDRGYEESVRVALGLSVNVFDAAINYRGQKSERAIGRALSKAFSEGAASRDEVFVSTKGGYLPHDAEDPRDPRTYVRDEFAASGASPSEIAAGVHCMAPAYLSDQLEKSRRNLGLDAIDLYYLHNVETQFSAVDRGTFRGRLAEAAAFLEEAAGRGLIGAWGLATWNGLRVPPEHPEHLSLSETLAVAREAGGEGHHFRAVQLPFNLGMAQAAVYRSQETASGRLPALAAAAELGLAAFGSASLLQGRLAAGLPEDLREAFPECDSAARTALQFARSAPGITTALSGVSSPSHARDNFGLSRVAPASADRIRALFA
jgi:aryl-alcohol dehydrogenase-like predicted oxidoreductase